MQPGCIKTAKPALVDYGVGRGRPQFGNDVGIPGVADEDAAGAPVWSFHRLSDVQRTVFDEVWARRRPSVAHVGLKGHLEVDDRQARRPVPMQGPIAQPE